MTPLRTEYPNCCYGSLYILALAYSTSVQSCIKRNVYFMLFDLHKEHVPPLFAAPSIHRTLLRNVKYKFKVCVQISSNETEMQLKPFQRERPARVWN
jgi:hypothetical protein